MSGRGKLITAYTQDLRGKCGEANPDMEFLTKVTVGLGPPIYNDGASKVSGSDKTELDWVKQNFLTRKLGLTDGPESGKAIEAVIEKYGKSNRNRHRAMVYYLSAEHFKKGSVYNK